MNEKKSAEAEAGAVAEAEVAVQAQAEAAEHQGQILSKVPILPIYVK